MATKKTRAGYLPAASVQGDTDAHAKSAEHTAGPDLAKRILFESLPGVPSHHHRLIHIVIIPACQQ
jgi:hypothetical protein